MAAEYETVTIQLPKTLMAYTRFKAELHKITPERQLQSDLMDVSNAEFEDMHAHEYLELSSFQQAYFEIRNKMSKETKLCLKKTQL